VTLIVTQCLAAEQSSVLRVVGIDAKVREQERPATWLRAAAFGFYGNEHSVDPRDCLCVIKF
jgi:hypothetical protein